jgi:hypothetical protein
VRIDDERLRVATLHFVVKQLVARILKDNPTADLKYDVLSALEQITPCFGSDDVERGVIRVSMHSEANAILDWAIEGKGSSTSLIEGLPLPTTSHYREWR